MSERPPPFGVAATVSLLLLLGVLAANTLGLVLAPAMLTDQALLLVALRPTPTILLLVGGQLDPVALLLTAVPMRLLLDLSYFLAARHGGLALLARHRWGELVVAPVSRRSSARALLWLAVIYTSTPVDVALGLGPTPLRQFVAAAATGSTISTVFYLMVATSVAGPAGAVGDWLARHSFAATAAIVLGLAAAALVALRRRARKAPDVTTPDR